MAIWAKDVFKWHYLLFPDEPRAEILMLFMRHIKPGTFIDTTEFGLCIVEESHFNKRAVEESYFIATDFDDVQHLVTAKQCNNFFCRESFSFYNRLLDIRNSIKRSKEKSINRLSSNEGSNKRLSNDDDDDAMSCEIVTK